MSFIPITVTLKNGELITIRVPDIAEAPKLAELKRSYFSIYREKIFPFFHNQD